MSDNLFADRICIARVAIMKSGVLSKLRWLAVPMLLAVQVDAARADGKIVDAVRVVQQMDAIPGVAFNEVPYAEYRARFKGSCRLPYDPTRKAYSYDMPVWIITPAKLAAGNGTIIVDPLHNQAVINTRPSGAEGEQALALKILSPGFLFRNGNLDGSPAPNYTWVGIRWEPRSLTTPFPQARYDHVFEQRNKVPPGTLDAPADRQGDLGKAMVADLADELRRGALTMRDEEEETTFATVERVIGFGHSQTGRLMRQLLGDPPSIDNGGGAHYVPLFDGWFIIGAGGAYDQWQRYDASGKPFLPASVIRDKAPAPEKGLVIELATEADIGPLLRAGAPGNEFVRFEDARSYRSYEIAGGAHVSWGTPVVFGRPIGAIFLPDLADSLEELAALSGVDPDFELSPVDAFDVVEEHPFAYTNPLDWNPVARALFVALDDWLIDEEMVPPQGVWLRGKDGPGKYGDATFGRDGVGNVLGGIRLPDVEVGRGRFFGISPDRPFAGGNILYGAYFDRHDRFANHGKYLSAFSKQADRLVDDGFLLPADRDALVDSAARSRVGKE
jgi:Alpha/beta hydrolase domain